MSKFKECASLPSDYWLAKNFAEYDRTIEAAKPIFHKWLSLLPINRCHVDDFCGRLHQFDVMYTCEQSGITAKGEDIYKLHMKLGVLTLDAVCVCIHDTDGVDVIVEKLSHTFGEGRSLTQTEACLHKMVEGLVEAEVLGTEDAIPYLKKGELAEGLKQSIRIYSALQTGHCYLCSSHYSESGTSATVKRIVVSNSKQSALAALVERENPGVRASHSAREVHGLEAWVLANNLEFVVSLKRSACEV